MAESVQVSPEKAVVITPEKEGWLKKRGARMHRWSFRYFALVGPTLTYKLKQDSPTIRGSFDLEAGCILTDVEEDSSSKKDKKLFSFWIVWPEIDKSKKDKQNEKVLVENVSDGEDQEKEKEEKVPKAKKLKDIVESEVQTSRQKQKTVEKQLEKHHEIDNNLSMGMKVAAVAIGGVVVGAITAGVGLVPYLALVSLTAVASGGVVALQFRRPSDSRLILAAETMVDALLWKAAVEEQIIKLQVKKKPLLPDAADPILISQLIGISERGGGWTKVGQVEEIRLMEQKVGDLDSSKDTNFSIGNEFTVCRKAQVIVPGSPLNILLALMEIQTPFWPKQGSIKIVQAVDDHADMLGAVFPISSSTGYFSSQPSVKHAYLCFSRFWKLDDDGTYLITYNSTTHPDFPPADIAQKCAGMPLDAVFTISPRKDYEIYDDDLREALITCTIQIPINNKFWKDISVEARNLFLNEFLIQLVDLREFISMSRFDVNGEDINVKAQPNLPKDSTLASTSKEKDFNEVLKNQNSFKDNRGSTSPATPKNRKLSNSTSFGSVTTAQPGSENIGDIKVKPTMLSRFKSGGTPTAISEPQFQLVKQGPLGRERIESKDRDKEREKELNEFAFSGNASRRRSQAVNTVASALRTQIANKEFEFGRIDRMISKKPMDAVKADDVSGNAAASPSEVKYSQLRAQADLLLKEVAKLKQQYVELTGVRYEQSRTIRRKLGKETQARLQLTDTHFAELVSPLYAMQSAASLAAIRICRENKALNILRPQSTSTSVDPSDIFYSWTKASHVESGVVKSFKYPPHWSTIQEEYLNSVRRQSHLEQYQMNAIAIILTTVISLAVALSLEPYAPYCRGVINLLVLLIERVWNQLLHQFIQ